MKTRRFKLEFDIPQETKLCGAWSLIPGRHMKLEGGKIVEVLNEREKYHNRDEWAKQTFGIAFNEAINLAFSGIDICKRKAILYSSTSSTFIDQAIIPNVCRKFYDPFAPEDLILLFSERDWNIEGLDENEKPIDGKYCEVFAHEFVGAFKLVDVPWFDGLLKG